MRPADHARRTRLDAKTFSLAPHRAAQVREFRFDDVVDRFACPSHVIRNMLANVVTWNPVPHAFAAFRRPPRAFGAETGRVFSRPGCPAPHPEEHWNERPPSRRPPPQHEHQRPADRYADQGRGEQVVLGFTPVAVVLADADGHAGLLDAPPRLIR